MCGISGYVRNDSSATSLGKFIHGLRKMGHRGPDDEGVTVIDRSTGQALDWATEQSASEVPLNRVDGSAKVVHDVAFGHRRFSIVDLSVSGHQPLWTTDRQICVSVNGEIYNHLLLRSELEELGWRFGSRSDTEVLAVAYRQWGTDCFRRLNGFWALSIYDAGTGDVILARDRLGKAPLYYTVAHDGTYWASEIGVLRSLAPTDFSVRTQSIADFVAHWRRDYEHTTFFSEIQTLPNGSWARVGPGGHLDCHRFWELGTERMAESDISVEEAADQLRTLLVDSTTLRLQADVPVAVQVSGGLDSSAVLAIAAQHAPSVSAFTVHFPDSPVDEEHYARMVAEHYRSNVSYNVVKPPATDLLEDLDFFIGLMGEPFHSPNQYTARGIWKEIADRGYRVNLYGSGGDEVFAGYSPLYFYPYIRRLVAEGNLGQAWHELGLLTDRSSGPLGIDRLLRALRTLPYGQTAAHAASNLKLRRIDPYVPPPGVKPRSAPSENIDERLRDLLQREQLNYWLRADNQNVMSIPLELRAPLLDYRIVDFAFSLPLSYLMRDGWMKWILRKAVEDDLPKEIVWRRVKSGFPFPLGDWLTLHQAQLLSFLDGSDCPYIDRVRLAASWQELARINPDRLWAIVSLGLWWKKSIQHEPLG